jgi:hypothetical protein
MKAANKPYDEIQRIWYNNFIMSPQEYIKNQGTAANEPIKGYGIDITLPFEFKRKLFNQ